MKRLAVILTLICVICSSASAQWYLFPGKKKQQEPKEPVKEQLQQEISVPVDSVPEIRDTLFQKDEFVLDIPQTINVTLLLPLRSAAKPSGNFYEFYTGALIAAADMGRSGQSININVYDTENKAVPIPQNVIDASDIIIGPVSSADIGRMLPKCPEGKYLISPLEPKAMSYTDTCRVIQLPVPWENQTSDLVEWLQEDMRTNDRLIIVADEDPSRMGEMSNYILARLEESGLECTTINSNSVSDIQLAIGDTRFVIASEDENFICTAANNIGNLASQTENVYLYGNSKLRSYDSIHSESLFKASAKLTSNYFVDYNDPDVKDFVLRFRALYNAEPSSFAFHGYDTMHYFISICSIYGRQWSKKITEYKAKGLQTDFEFEESRKTGYVNSAVRRIAFSPDLSTSLQ